MLEINKAVARKLATNPVDGGFNAARYAVVLMALGLIKNTESMAATPDCDGECGRDSCDTSTQKRNDVSILRAALDDLASLYDLSITGLKLPPDPVTDTGYLNMPMAPNILKQTLTEFVRIPGVLPALARQIEHLKTPKSPTRIMNIFKNCAACVGGGVGGAAISHIGCIMVPVISATSGAAISGGTMASVMMVSAPIIAAAATGIIDKLRGIRASPVKMIGAATLAFAIAAGMGAMGGHDGHGGGHETHAPSPENNHQNHHQHHQHHHHPR